VTPGSDGWLARAGDADALADTIQRALDAPVPPSARKTATAHDWNGVAERHLAIYERAASGVRRLPDATGGVRRRPGAAGGEMTRDEPCR
jgi:hypothetical protein